MAQVNATSLTGGTSKFLTSVLPDYGSYVPGSQSLYLYYKVTSLTSNTSVVTFGAYMEAYKKYYCNELDYIPQETDYYAFGTDTKLALSVNDGSYFNVCNYTDSRTNVVGSLLDYEIIGENTDTAYDYAYIGYAHYRYWLGDVNNQPWPEVAVSSQASTKVFIDWQYTKMPGVAGPGGRITQTIYLSFNNLPYISYYPTEITDTLESFPINYTVPDPSILDYLSFGILDTSGNLLAGYKMAPGADTSYNFILSDLDREALYARYDTVNTSSVQFGVRIKNYNEDPILVTYPMFLEIVIDPPTLGIEAIDTDSAATAATGNNKTLVRYQSDAKLTITPQPKKGASIVSYYVSLGNQKVSNQTTATFNNVQTNTFTLYAKDSRGNTSLSYLTLPMVDYFPLTSNLAAEPPTTDDKIKISLSGKYWSGNFGAINNSIVFDYKYTTNVDGNSRDWTRASSPTVNISQGNYTAYFSIDIPNHVDTYTVQVRAYDELNVIYSNSVTVKSLPLFDWGENDFNFNVPVSIQGNLTVSGAIITDGGDYVVQQGTSGIWTYRLWDSGVAECWGTVAPAAHSITSSWGSIYTKDNAIARQSYPFTFMDVPVVSMTLYNTSGNCWAYTGTVGSASLSPAFGLARGTSGNVTTGAQITAIGRWK